MSTRIIVGDSILKNVRNISDCHIYSLSGISIFELSTKICEILSVCPDTRVIMIHAGTNNMSSHSVSKILKEFENLIDQIKPKYPNIPLLLSSILPRPCDDVHMSAKIEYTNCLLRDLCVRRKCFYVASTKVFFKAGKLCHELFVDGLHLSKEGTKRLRQFFCQRLAELGTKPSNPYCHSYYLRRCEWQSTNIKTKYA
jgi:hypothetical protein